MSRYLTFLLVLLSSIRLLYAGEPNRLFYPDSSQVNERSMDSALLHQRMAEKDFQYDRQQIETENSFERFIVWLLDKLFEDFDGDDIIRTKKLIYWSIAIIGILALAYYLFKMSPSRFLKRENQEVREVRFMDYTGTSDDLAQNLKQAEEAGDYPLALRYLFITALSFLEKERIIIWRIEKTNADYLNELSEEWSKTPMRRLSTLFSYGYYGNYPIDKAAYMEAKQLFNLLMNKGGNA